MPHTYYIQLSMYIINLRVIANIIEIKHRASKPAENKNNIETQKIF